MIHLNSKDIIDKEKYKNGFGKKLLCGFSGLLYPNSPNALGIQDDQSDVTANIIEIRESTDDYANKSVDIEAYASTLSSATGGDDCLVNDTVNDGAAVADTRLIPYPGKGGQVEPESCLSEESESTGTASSAAEEDHNGGDEMDFSSLFGSAEGQDGEEGRGEGMPDFASLFGGGGGKPKSVVPPSPTKVELANDIGIDLYQRKPIDPEVASVLIKINLQDGVNKKDLMYKLRLINFLFLLPGSTPVGASPVEIGRTTFDWTQTQMDLVNKNVTGIKSSMDYACGTLDLIIPVDELHDAIKKLNIKKRIEESNDDDWKQLSETHSKLIAEKDEMYRLINSSKNTDPTTLPQENPMKIPTGNGEVFGLSAGHQTRFHYEQNLCILPSNWPWSETNDTTKQLNGEITPEEFKKIAVEVSDWLQNTEVSMIALAIANDSECDHLTRHIQEIGAMFKGINKEVKFNAPLYHLTHKTDAEKNTNTVIRHKVEPVDNFSRISVSLAPYFAEDSVDEIISLYLCTEIQDIMLKQILETLKTDFGVNIQISANKMAPMTYTFSTEDLDAAQLEHEIRRVLNPYYMMYIGDEVLHNFLQRAKTSIVDYGNGSLWNHLAQQQILADFYEIISGSNNFALHQRLADELVNNPEKFSPNQLRQLYTQRMSTNLYLSVQDGGKTHPDLDVEVLKKYSRYLTGSDAISAGFNAAEAELDDYEFVPHAKHTYNNPKGVQVREARIPEDGPEDSAGGFDMEAFMKMMAAMQENMGKSEDAPGAPGAEGSVEGAPGAPGAEGSVEGAPGAPGAPGAEGSVEGATGASDDADDEE